MKFLTFILISIFIHQINCGAPIHYPSGYLPPLCVSSYSADIFAPDGSYIKTACFVYEIRFGSYSASQSKCMEYGMDLFRIPDKNSYDGLVSHIMTTANLNSIDKVYVNGRQSFGIFRSQPDNVVVYKPYTSSAPSSGSSGDCLAIVNSNNVIEASGAPCDGPIPFFCEFYR